MMEYAGMTETGTQHMSYNECTELKLGSATHIQSAL